MRGAPTSASIPQARCLCVVAAVSVSTALWAYPAVAADGDEGSASGREPRQVSHRGTVSAELAVDSNARRQQIGAEVGADILTYLYASGRIESRRPGSLLSARADAGAKKFLDTPAEDTLAGRLAVHYSAAPRTGLELSVDALYEDRVQRGDDWEDVSDHEHLSCRPPSGGAAEGYRCNRRDYRRGSLGGAIRLQAAEWSVRGRMGPSFLDYKPNRQFSYAGPDAKATAGRVVLGAHHLHGHVGASLRFYHSRSVTYRLVPDETGQRLEVVRERRVEQVFSTGIGWRYRGPLLLAAAVSATSSNNNSYGMDAVRGRAELSGAVRLGDSTRLVATSAFQLAYYPEGNVFGWTHLPSDEDERRSSVGLQVSRRLTDSLSLLVKGQAFVNEISTDSLRFRRQVLHAGVRWSS